MGREGGDEGATAALGSELIEVAADGVSAVDDGNDTSLVASAPATEGASLLTEGATLKPGERLELAAALPAGSEGADGATTRLGDREPVCDAGDDPDCETEDFGEPARGDELESALLEPVDVAPPSSAAAMPGVAANATPTPAVTAPTWSHRITGNPAELRFG